MVFDEWIKNLYEKNDNALNKKGVCDSLTFSHNVLEFFRANTFLMITLTCLANTGALQKIRFHSKHRKE